MLQKLRHTLGPLFLLLVCPPFAILLWYTNTTLQGSFSNLFNIMSQQGILPTIIKIWQPVMFGSPIAWMCIAVYTLLQLILTLYLPGKAFFGPITPKGNVPKYKANGFLAYTVTVITFCLATFYFHFFSATIIYDNLGAILGALNIASLIFCAFLYVKGRFKPSTSDCSVSGNLLFDYYWGTELYPQIGRLNLKMFITCRFGMMSWVIILLSYAAKQAEMVGLSDSMFVSVALQIIYVTKFYLWETGYWRSLDIMHDRAGFYICWGCMVWVPCVYTSPAMYLVLHPIHLGVTLSLLILILGALSISINYLADLQRQRVRATNGNCKIWGKKPEVTLATYQTEQGEIKQNLLLSSGWWGISRHFHYIPEIAAAFLWSVPALFINYSPYFYVTFLTALLTDRAFRDDQRCAKKYGQFWQSYCQRVPYKIIPFLV